MTDIKCKCSHLQSEHKKRFAVVLECNACQCNKYQSIKRPGIFDKILVFTSIFSISVLTYAFIIIYDFFNKNTIQQITDSGINLKYLVLIFFFGFVAMSAINQSESITNYFKFKKRKDWN